MLADFVSSLLSWFLSTFALLQDLLLSLPRFRRLVLWANERQYRELVAAALRAPSEGEAEGYYVDPQAKQTLQFAGLHALSKYLSADEVLAPAVLLPPVSRVLLTSEERHSGKLLEAMVGRLLVVDQMLIASLAGLAFSRPPETFLPALGGGGGSGGRGSGAGSLQTKLEVAWEALDDAVSQLEQPTVVLLKCVDQLLCGSWEAHDAFNEVLGSPEMLALKGPGPRAPVVLVGACTLCESGASVARTASSGGADGAPGEAEDSGADGDGDGRTAGRGGRGGGGIRGMFGGLGRSDELDLDDELGLGSLLLSLGKLASESRPNPRSLLPKLFPTRVKLQPPPPGPLAVRHQQRMHQDQARAMEEENYRAAAAVAAGTGVSLPPKSSGLYEAPRGWPYSRQEWGKVLSWACAVENVRRKQRRMLAEAQVGSGDNGAGDGLRARRASGMRRALSSGAADGASSHTSELGADGLCSPLLDTQGPVPGSSGGSGSGGTLAAYLGLGLGWLASSASSGELTGWLSPWHVARTALALPRAALALLGRCLRGALGLPRPWAPGGAVNVGEEAERRAGELDLAAQQPSADEAEPAELEAAVAEHGSLGGGGSGGFGTLALCEQSLRYGLGMLQRNGGGVKGGVAPENSYERQLLGEVLVPEDCGAGFSEARRGGKGGVGALAEAKRALREAVQLPLQHPELFAGGALAHPSKGVLLFGPPGTGKTLLARAAAAECGAAFLPINPSSVASKWFGDSRAGARVPRQQPACAAARAPRLAVQHCRQLKRSARAAPKVRYIRATFSLAAKLAPCVIFIDEVDALLGRRSSREHEALREMKNEVMNLWDGIRGQGAGGARVLVLAATNRPFDLDEAVLRRFTHRVLVPLPDRGAREEVLRVVLAGERLAADVDLSRLAEQTEGFSGSDLRQLCIQAAMLPVREFLEAEGKSKAGASASSSGAGGGGASGSGAAAAAAGEGEGAAGPGPGSPHALAAAAPPKQRGSLARLDSLLRQADNIAGQVAEPKAALRPVCASDFEQARKEVTASVDPDSSTVQELKQWNERYGTSSGKKAPADPRLSYFM
eukprot:scaffold5.g837.t1